MDCCFFAPGSESASYEPHSVGDAQEKAEKPLRCRIFARALAAKRRGARHNRQFQRLGRGGFVLAAFCLLAGCVDSYVAAQAPQAPPPEAGNMARRPGVSPGGTSVAMASLAGGPDAIRDRFSQAFEDAAKTQQIVMATPAAADYFVRGYLNAVPEGEATAVTYVLDIFDAKKRRTQRVEDQILIKAKAADPWSVVDDAAVSALAAKSAAALAAVLTNTPEAILAAAKTQPDGAAAVQADDGRTIVAASPAGGAPTAENPGSLALH
jgi:hypothetical protein